MCWFWLSSGLLLFWVSMFFYNIAVKRVTFRRVQRSRNVRSYLKLYPSVDASTCLCISAKFPEPAFALFFLFFAHALLRSGPEARPWPHAFTCSLAISRCSPRETSGSAIRFLDVPSRLSIPTGSQGASWGRFKGGGL